MDATITLGPGAISGGSTVLDGLLYTLYLADSVHTSMSGATAVAATQPEEDGFDGKVTFTGAFAIETGTITGFKIEYDGVEEFSATGLDIDYATMKSAIESADEDPETHVPNFEPLKDVLQGINWTMDASAATKAVLAFGTGGVDDFTLTKFDDLMERDGGSDVADMGAGNDTLFFGNTYNFSAGEANSHAFIDGGKGSDTLAFFMLDNPFLGEGLISITTDTGVIFDLDAGTVVLKGSNDQKNNRYVNFENVNGSEQADVILGSTGANVLDGYLGNDEITGRGGRDILTGGGGKDDFNFVKPTDSAAGKNHDIITDFEHKLDDIDLSKLHPDTETDKFTFVGQKALKNAGDLHFILNDEKGTAHDTTMVEANLKGDAKPEIQIELTGLVHLDKGDFFL